MIRAYGENRKVYVIIPKGISKDQAIKAAAVELHEKPNNLEISFADKESETKDEMTFLVERKRGQFYCVSRKGNK